MPQTMTEFSTACWGNRLLRMLPLSYHKHLLLGLPRSDKVTPIQGFGQTVKLATREWCGYRPAWGRQWLVLSWKQSPGPAWSCALTLFSELLQCLGAHCCLLYCWHRTCRSTHREEMKSKDGKRATASGTTRDKQVVGTCSKAGKLWWLKANFRNTTSLKDPSSSHQNGTLGKKILTSACTELTQMDSLWVLLPRCLSEIKIAILTTDMQLNHVVSHDSHSQQVEAFCF